jgi:SAM-dependent methyltransferase
MSDIEESVREFYDTYGWVKQGGKVGESEFREFSPAYYPYHRGVNERTLKLFDGRYGRLLMGGGGDLPETHVAIATRFGNVTCLDISERALEIAQRKLDNRAQCLHASLLEIPAPDNTFDAAYCAHVIYHIDSDLQEKAVDELIRVTKPGGRVVIIYSNPECFIDRLIERKGRTTLLWKLKRRRPVVRAGDLYFHAHKLGWWKRFEGKARLNIVAWDATSWLDDQELFWNDAAAAVGYRLAGWIERLAPAFAARSWRYPVIVLDKKK